MSKKISAEKTARDIRRQVTRFYWTIITLPTQLEAGIGQFVEYYNNERYHESPNNLTPADIFYGRGAAILEKCAEIKQNTLAMRKQIHYNNQVTI